MSQLRSVTEQLDLNTVLILISFLASQTSRFIILTKPLIRSNRQHYPKKSQYIPDLLRVEPYPPDSSITLILDKSEYVALLYLSFKTACLVNPTAPVT